MNLNVLIYLPFKCFYLLKRRNSSSDNPVRNLNLPVIYFNKLFFLILFSFTSIFNSVGQVDMDSLNSIWQNETLKDTTRLNAIAMMVSNSNPDSVIILSELHHHFAEKKDLKKEIAKANSALGEAYIPL